MQSCGEESLEKGFAFFALQLTNLLGYKPKFDRCTGCSRSVEAELILFSSEKGGIICRRCSRADQAYDQAYLRLSKDSVVSALKLQSIKTEDLNTYNIPKEQLKEITNVILTLLEYHTGRGKDLKSLEFLDIGKELK
jgi:DNA repair protein RecO